MTGPIRDELELNEERARVATDFFESYANTALGRSNDPSETDRMDAATSLRRAGQWAMLFDPARARRLLNKSGRLWLEMGHPFGAFLVAAFWTEQHDRLVAEPYVGDIARRVPQARRPDNAQQLSLSLIYPQQRAYLLLALAAVPDGIDRLALVDSATKSPQRNGVAPIGALGTPIRLHWRIALALLAADRGRHLETAATDVARSLAEIADVYGRTIDSAMANRYLWDGGGAPVDVADIDVVGMISIAAAQVGPSMLRQHLNTAKDRLASERGHIVLDIGRHMITGLYD